MSEYTSSAYDTDRAKPETILFPAQSTVLDESVLLQRIVSRYEVGTAKSCRFLSRGDADIYRVTTGEADYYLKVYRPPREAAHVEAEACFVAELDAAGVPVVRAVRRLDGQYASEAWASEGTRPMLLFEEAPPPLPKDPTAEQMRALGETVARVHDLGDARGAGDAIPTFGLETLEAERASHIRRFTSEQDAALMASVIDWLRPQLAKTPREAPEWGLCHADLVLSNVRARGDDVSLFDFGGLSRTYRAYDLAVVYWSLEHRSEQRVETGWEAFLAGYEQIRPLPEHLRERLPAFRVLRELAFLGGNAATLPLRLGTEPFESDFMKEGFDRIRAILSEAGATFP